MSSHSYDICIVGAGLIGSAAARHATLISPESRVILVGPKEPKDRRECQHGLFGAHYDEARITRMINPNLTWIDLAKRSIARYKEIETKSGIKFYSEVGVLTVVSKDGEVAKISKENANDMKINYEILEKDGVAEAFPCLSIDADREGILERREAGLVNPRAQLTAQQTLARQHGCSIFEDVVDRVLEVTENDGSKRMQVTTASGRVILSRKVLLATGSFTEFRDLLPAGKTLDTTLFPLAATFAEIQEEDAERLKGMPALVFYTDDDMLGILPPVKYPDGKYYLKVTSACGDLTELKTASEVAEWYKSRGDTHKYQYLVDILFRLVRGVTPLSTHTDGCVITQTPTGQLYCDMITPTLGITVGGNGYAAKSADEIGRMGARMIIAGKWDHDLPQEKFKARFKRND